MTAADASLAIGQMCIGKLLSECPAKFFGLCMAYRQVDIYLQLTRIECLDRDSLPVVRRHLLCFCICLSMVGHGAQHQTVAILVVRHLFGRSGRGIAFGCFLLYNLLFFGILWSRAQT